MSEQHFGQPQVDNNRYGVRISLTITKDGQEDTPMMEQDLVYRGMRYNQVVVLEKILVDMLGDLNTLGEAASELKGQGPELQAIWDKFRELQKEQAAQENVVDAPGELPLPQLQRSRNGGRRI